jgi:hypothetical protein
MGVGVFYWGPICPSVEIEFCKDAMALRPEEINLLLSLASFL